jgi:hypothetical protein
LFLINSPLKFKSIADIDEASPSEDEEAAQRALRGEEVDSESGIPRDVLDDHRAQNRPNRPPNQQRLLQAARHQLEGAGNTDVFDIDLNGNADDNEDEEDGKEDDTGKRTRRHKPEEASPKTARHYPECWREAIDRGKEQFRRFVMVYNLFPGRDAHLPDAARILSKVIADERSNGKLFNPSKS